MAKYLVTGGAGFIGSNIVKKLLSLGEDVCVLDDFSTGHRTNLTGLEDSIDLINGDITCLETCRAAIKGVDYVLHQAAIPSVPRSVADPIRTSEVNINGTLNMLTAARDEGVRRLVYAASSSAYGSNPELPKNETMAAAPLSPYALQKYCGEKYCQIFTEIYGLETVCLRYFNVFGPGQDPDSPYAAVIPAFIKALLTDKAPVIFGDGQTSRDFTYIDNVVAANILATGADTKAAGQVFNIATGRAVSLRQLVDMINAELGKDISPVYDNERTGDVKHSLARIQKADQLLGYKPQVLFREGLQRTIEYYKRLIAKSAA